MISPPHRLEDPTLSSPCNRKLCSLGRKTEKQKTTTRNSRHGELARTGERTMRPVTGRVDGRRMERYTKRVYNERPESTFGRWIEGWGMRFDMAGWRVNVARFYFAFRTYAAVVCTSIYSSREEETRLE